MYVRYFEVTDTNGVRFVGQDRQTKIKDLAAAIACLEYAASIYRSSLISVHAVGLFGGRRFVIDSSSFADSEGVL